MSGVERQLPSNILLSVQYIGKKGTRLYFAGGTNFDLFGPQIESMTSAQIGNLGDYVPNPFASVPYGFLLL